MVEGVVSWVVGDGWGIQIPYLKKMWSHLKRRNEFPKDMIVMLLELFDQWIFDGG